MLERVRRVFERYHFHRGAADQVSIPLRLYGDTLVGYIERLQLCNGSIRISGWSIAEEVGLDGGPAHHVRARPSVLRSDVNKVHSLPADVKTGFDLALPSSAQDIRFWCDLNGTQLIIPMADLISRFIKDARRKSRGTFLRDALTALPHYVVWRATGQFSAKERVRQRLGFQRPESDAALKYPLFKTSTSAVADFEENTSGASSVTIILPVFNALDVLKQCLQRIAQHTDIPWRLIVIEDASSDLSVRPFLRAWASQKREAGYTIDLLENETNLGFIQSVNRGFERALAFDDPVVLLNSDALVPVGWASRLVDPLFRHERVATVTPMSNDAEILSAPVICRASDIEEGAVDHLDQIARRMIPDAVLADLPTGVGFCMAININALRQAPRFDTIFGRGYGEEVDWCRQVQRRGWRHLGHGGIFVEHRGGASFGKEEKRARIQANGRIVSRRYPEFDGEVQAFIATDPLKSARLALALAATGAKGRPVSIFVAHSMGGGADQYLSERLAREIAQGDTVVVIRVGGPKAWGLECHTAAGVTVGETERVDLLPDLLAPISERRVVYSCGVGAQNIAEMLRLISDLSGGPKASLDILFHDFLPISPVYTLLPEGGSFSPSSPVPRGDDPAHAWVDHSGTRKALSDWSALWTPIIKQADRLVCFSKDSARIVARAYPHATRRLVVEPHDLGIEVVPVARSDSPERQTIGILGNIGFQKGAGVVQDLGRWLVHDNRVSLTVIGNIDPAFSMPNGVTVHGSYSRSEISALAERYGITAWFIPSIWPETFSYTTHEALATGLPVWCFDLGAQAEAVKRAANGGGVLPLDAGPEEIVRRIARIGQEGKCVA